MKLSLEIMITVLMLGLYALMTAWLVGGSMVPLNARDSFHQFQDRIEYEDFSQDVINQCIAQAEDQGFRLVVIDLSEAAGSSCCLLSLYYRQPVPAPGTTTRYVEGVINGYARM